MSLPSLVMEAYLFSLKACLTDLEKIEVDRFFSDMSCLFVPVNSSDKGIVF